MRLNRDFFSHPTLDVAKALLGKRLVRVEEDGVLSAGLIVETEGYVGTDDMGCHARAGRTKRNRSMWGAPGHAYVYFTYGMHYLLNVVTEMEGFPAAVLIRAILPIEGVERMRVRRRGKPERILTDGPAKLTQALALDLAFDGVDLCSVDSTLFLEEGVSVDPDKIVAKPRVGLFSVPEPWKSIEWNYRIQTAELKLRLDD
ncbi:MAG: DNA-3-methyladenine glycosylase [Deltaproteobacteria bacterium]|nr:MAG: DNA-3-methyladenine glycosylase [Deltaproteobacteria bacterium]